MKKLLLSLLASFAFVTLAQAATGGIAWDRFPTQKANDQAALQHGAKLFVNYCLSCHSASHVRFNRLRDIGLTDEEIKNYLLFTTEKVGDLMTVAMSPKDAREWFGAVPPDLSVIARSRSAPGQGTGADYLYTYLRTYYPDDAKATGWNNLAFPNVGMPHVLWELQGERRPVFDKRVEHGHEVEVFTGRWDEVRPGSMSAREYDDAVGDLVAFMYWMSEPVRAERVRIGVAVLIFLGLFTVVAWRMNAAFWKDVK
jgi:ubiquinol-cytochrome c reductase cytochrome c1 subunit